jgi:hypothetical protein
MSETSCRIVTQSLCVDVFVLFLFLACLAVAVFRAIPAFTAIAERILSPSKDALDRDMRRQT